MVWYSTLYNQREDIMSILSIIALVIAVVFWLGVAIIFYLYWEQRSGQTESCHKCKGKCGWAYIFSFGQLWVDCPRCRGTGTAPKRYWKVWVDRAYSRFWRLMKW